MNSISLHLQAGNRSDDKWVKLIEMWPKCVSFTFLSLPESAVRPYLSVSPQQGAQHSSIPPPALEERLLQKQVEQIMKTKSANGTSENCLGKIS